jgi:hypothetical protein
MIISYMALRKILGLLGLSLVPVLIVGAVVLDHTNEIQVSVSAYYYTSMRNVLVGMVCCISLFLLSYHGNERTDSIASKLAGIFALGIAFFPTSQSNDKTDMISIFHYLTSGIFFAVLSYISIFLFTKSRGYKTMEKRKRNRVYRVCGIIMAISVIGIPLAGIDGIHAAIGFLKPTLLLEALALTAFGISWLTKGEFLLADKGDEKPAEPRPHVELLKPEVSLS